MGVVEHLHVAAHAGAPMQARAEAEALAGVGLSGDRYAAGAGYWRDSRVTRDLTLVEAEVAEALPIEPGELRRNATTRGVRLNDLVGRVFWVGDVLCRGTELCEPCSHLEEVTGKLLLRPLVHRGGLRAAVVRSGAVRVGDPVEPAEILEGVGVVVTRGRRALLGRRLSAHGRAAWSFPGGKPRPGESPEECALRELHEETGLRGRRPRVVGESLDGFPDSRLVYRTRFVAVEAEGEARAAEPHKNEAWDWFDWNELPRPLFEPVASFVAR
jgi:ADP-ribose pyrophosphatase YjhB (NUDIX family)